MHSLPSRLSKLLKESLLKNVPDPGEIYQKCGIDQNIQVNFWTLLKSC